MAVLLGVDVPELPLLLHHGAPNAMVQHSEAFVTTGAGTRGKQRRTHMTLEKELVFWSTIDSCFSRTDMGAGD